MAGQFEDMLPAVAEVIEIEDKNGRVVRVVEIDEADVTGLEDLLVHESVFVELGSAIAQSADIELVEVTVGPTNAGLEDLVELGEVEIHWQLEGSPDSGVDPDDVDLGADEELMGFVHGCDHVVLGDVGQRQRQRPTTITRRRVRRRVAARWSSPT